MAYEYNTGRDDLARTLMAQNNPAPGYLSPPQLPPAPSGLGAPLNSARPPSGPMGAGIGGPQQSGLALPGVMTPGQLPQGMAPQVAVGGGMPPAQPQPSMPMPGAVQPPRY
jgi:hypothetical protein